MFQSLRLNSPLYIFHKGDNPVLEIGYVASQPITRPKYSVPPSIGQAQELVVDVVAKINNIIVNYNNLPAQLDIADSYSNGENIVISTNKDAMNAEVASLKQKSVDIINSVDTHKNNIVTYDKILSELNPEYAEKKQQQTEINSLKQQMSEVTNNMKELMETNKRLIEELNKRS